MNPWIWIPCLIVVSGLLTWLTTPNKDARPFGVMRCSQQPESPPAPKTFRITRSAPTTIIPVSLYGIDELREKRLEILRKDLVG